MTVSDLITQTAQSLGVNPALALEVAITESSLNQSARGSHGEIGVYQLMPATAAALGVDPTDLAQNVRGGIAYLKQQLARFQDVAAALAAYNWGPENVAGAISNFGSDWISHAPGSTRNYIAKILSGMGQYQVGVNTAAVVDAAASAVGPSTVDSLTSSFTSWVSSLSSEDYARLGLVAGVGIALLLFLRELGD